MPVRDSSCRQGDASRQPLVNQPDAAGAPPRTRYFRHMQRQTNDLAPRRNLSDGNPVDMATRPPGPPRIPLVHWPETLPTGRILIRPVLLYWDGHVTPFQVYPKQGAATAARPRTRVHAPTQASTGRSMTRTQSDRFLGGTDDAPRSAASPGDVLAGATATGPTVGN